MNYIKSSLLLVVALSSNFIGASAAAGSDAGAKMASDGTKKMVKVWFARFAKHKHPSKNLRLFGTSNTTSDLFCAEQQVNAGQYSLDAVKKLAAQEWQTGAKKFELVRVNDIIRNYDDANPSKGTYEASEKEVDLAHGCITSPTVALTTDYTKFVIVDEEEQAKLLPKPSAAAATAAAAAAKK